MSSLRPLHRGPVSALALLLALSSLGGAAFGQSAPPQSAPPQPVAPAEPSAPAGTFGEQIEVSVVNLEVVVTDAQGNRISGLRPEDFHILVDGREVPVAFFDEILQGVAVAAAPLQLAPGEEPPEAPPGAHAPGQPVPTSYLVFVDDYFGIPRDRNLVLDRLSDDLGGLGPEDRVAMVAFDGSKIDLLSGWTGDAAAIRTAVQTAKKRKGWKAFVEAQRARGNPDQLARLRVDQLRGVYGALIVTLEAFSDAPGRRVALLVSGGWPFSVNNDPDQASTRRWNAFGALERVAATANSTGFTLYPIDAPGQEAGSGTSAAAAESPFVGDKLPGQGGAPARTRAEVLADAMIPATGNAQSAPDLESLDLPEVAVYADAFGEFEKEAALLTLARRTGGKALINGQRANALAQTIADNRSYYWLGFNHVRRRDGRLHGISVRVDRPGVEVRSRQQFVDMSRALEASLVTEQAALLGPDPGGEGGRQTGQLGLALGPPHPAGRGKVDLPFRVVIPLSEIVLDRSGKHPTTRLELRVMSIDDDGNRSDLTTLPLEFPIDDQTAELPAISYDAALRIQNRPHVLVFTLADKVSGNLLVARADWEP